MVYMYIRMPSPIRNWDDLRVFLAAHREGSLTRAARALAVNQSTVSRRLASLEECLGARLFDRLPEGLALTGAGAEILPTAEQLEGAAHEIARAAAGWDEVVEGSVRVALMEPAGADFVAPALPEFFAAHPGIRIELTASTGLADLVRREADLALRTVRPQAGDLVIRRAVDLGYGVYASTGYLASIGRPDSLESLDWLAFDDSLAYAPELRWLRKRVPDARMILRTSTITTIIAAAVAGTGAAILPRAVAARHPALEQIPVEPDDLPRVPLWLVGHAALRRVPRVRAVHDFLLRICAQAA